MMSNEFSHLAWTKGDIPRDVVGNYLVYLNKPLIGSRIAVCRVAKTMNSFMVTINSNFEFDLGDRKIEAWVSTNGLEPAEDV